MNRSYSSRFAFLPVSVLSVACVFLTASCGGSQPAPAPAESPAAPVAPAPVVAEPSAPPAAAPAEPAPPHAERRKGRRHHGISAMLLMSVHSLELKPEQKTEVAAIEADLEKLGEQHKGTGEKLGNDVSEGVAAGKIDRAKTNADIKELSKAVEATVPGIQDAVNRLHKTLDPEQRKAVVASMTAMAEKMRERGAEMGTHGAGRGAGMGKPGGGHDKHEYGPGPGKHGHAKGEPGAAGPRGPGMGGHGPMAMLTHDLALTPEQNEKIRAKLEAEVKAQKAAMQGQMTAMTKQLEAIGKAFVTETFDAKKVGVGKQAPAMVKRMAESGVKFAEIVLAVLTPEQRAKFAERVREHASDPE
ncbi:MAG TPA: Spy/CpxP family protein refolding chaperone [Polyangiaceae bacterium]